MSDNLSKPLKISLIAGEHSGDALGAKLMEGLKKESQNQTIEFKGLGGDLMAKQGLTSLFPMEEVAVMGPAAIIARLPNLIKRVHQCVAAILEQDPDLLVIIDSPEFTHPIAKRVRKKARNIPIINYVSPTIWAWRPGRAKKMKPYVDEVLALLPFEPRYHQELGGPSCHYVGHPLIEKKDWIENLDLTSFKAKHNHKSEAQTLVLLPGSRSNEIKHLMSIFGEVTKNIIKNFGPINLYLPTVPHLKATIEKEVKEWPQQPILLSGEEDKFSAFKTADVALAASGTVTLELALSNTPMVVAYKYDWYLHLLRPLIKANMFALANHILGEKAFPELIQHSCTTYNITQELLPLFDKSSKQFKFQNEKLGEIEHHMFKAGNEPSRAAAKRCLMMIKK